MKRSLFAAAVFAGLIFTGGCMTAKPPVAVSRTTYSEIQKKEQQQLPPDTKRLTLAEAQDIAIQNNPSFKSAYFAIVSARSQYYKAFSYYMPTVTFSYGIGQNYTQAGNRAAGNNTQVTYSTPGLNMSLLVFDSFQREFNLIAAKYNWEESKAAEQDARRLLLRSVAYAYNDVMLANAKSRIAVSNMKYNYDLLKETELKFEAGASPLSDVLNFKVNYNSAESSLYSSEYSSATAKYALAALLGLTEGTIADAVEFPEMPSPDGEMLAGIDFYLDQALKNRPDLKQYREALESAKYSYYSSIAAFGPSVTFNAALDYSNNSNRVTGKWGNDNSHTRPHSWGFDYGLTVSWELFSGGRTYFSMRAAQASMASADFQLANTWITVINDVRTAYDNYNTNLKQVKLNQKNLELVRKQRDLVKQEYTAGSTGITRLNEAQNALVSAESSLAEATINMHNAKAQLEAATNSI